MRTAAAPGSTAPTTPVVMAWPIWNTATADGRSPHSGRARQCRCGHRQLADVQQGLSRRTVFDARRARTPRPRRTCAPCACSSSANSARFRPVRSSTTACSTRRRIWGYAIDATTCERRWTHHHVAVCTRDERHQQGRRAARWPRRSAARRTGSCMRSTRRRARCCGSGRSPTGGSAKASARRRPSGTDSSTSRRPAATGASRVD